MNEPTLSVVIPAFNRRELVGLTVRALLRTEADPALYEIIVVDDGSTDGTSDLTTELGRENVRCIRRTKNIGKPNNPGLARNVGIKAAVGKWVAFCDCDVLHLHDVILATVTQVKADAIYHTRGIWIHERDFDSATRVGFESGRADMPCYFWWVAPRHVLVEIGGFDERFTDYGAEDEDIQVRLRRHGLLVQMIPGQFAVGVYASRGLPRGVISRAQNAQQHEWKRTDMTIVRNIGTNWGDPGPAEGARDAV